LADCTRTAHAGAPQVLAELVEAAGLVVPGAEDLELLDAAQAGLQLAGQLPGQGAHGLVGHAQLAAGHADQHGHHRRHQQDQQRQVPGQQEELDRQADDDQRVADDDDPGRGQGLAEQRDVVEDAAEHAPVRARLVLGQRQAGLVAEDLLAQVRHGMLGHRLAGHVGHVVHQPLGGEGQGQQQRQAPAGLRVLADQALVHQVLQQRGHQRLQRRRGGHGQQGHAAVRQ
jgi:hypothetical protein